MLLSPQLCALVPDVFGLRSLYSGSKVCCLCLFLSHLLSFHNRHQSLLSLRIECLSLLLGNLSAKVYSDSPPYCSQLFFYRPHIGHQSLSPTIGFSSIPVLNELHLVSSGSKSHLISGGDSSYLHYFCHCLTSGEVN